MHDIKWIRQQPEAFDAALKRRGLPARSADILAIDEQKRALVTQQGQLQAERNSLAKEVGAKKKAGENVDALMERSKAINEQLKAIDEQLADNSELDAILLELPNILAEDVPEGLDESDNVERHKYGSKPSFSFVPKQHFEIGEALGMMDFDTAAKLSGARFVLLRGALARLERALAQFMLDTHREEFGYEEVIPPLLVKAHTMRGTGQLPKFAEDSFVTTNDYWLIPTSEVSLTNMVADSILTEEELPLRLTAYTPCFRSEAGSAGRDTRGMIRQHQFSKVELVSITTPEQSAVEHERMLGAAETILQKLGLHYRVITLCAGDTGFSAAKTYDIEVWLPGQDAYREISSVSNCHAFQARRMQTRFRRKGEQKPESVHTLNGSGLAVGRTMVALLENYQQANGSVLIPEVLQSYLGGMTQISANETHAALAKLA